jgi:hypothetical protein
VAGPSLALLREIAFRSSHINDLDFERLADSGYRLKGQMRDEKTFDRCKFEVSRQVCLPPLHTLRFETT